MFLGVTNDAIVGSQNTFRTVIAPTGRRTPGLLLRRGIWHIDKIIDGTRICESTRTGGRIKAETPLARRVTQTRDVHLFGEPCEHSFCEAATKFLAENQRALAPHVRSRLEKGRSELIINRDLAVVRHIPLLAGSHSEFVFTRDGSPVTHIYNSGSKGARRLAAARYEGELGCPSPAGFRFIRVHDLKHTYVYSTLGLA